MIYIAHRGNMNGPNLLRENCPSYIKEALSEGFDVEVDIWFENDTFYLGHDKPEFEVYYTELANPRWWCHAKNLPALVEMLKFPTIHCFWHQNDNLALTSRNYIWTYPGKELGLQSVAVLPELFNYKQDITGCVAVCSDYIKEIRDGYVR